VFMKRHAVLKPRHNNTSRITLHCIPRVNYGMVSKRPLLLGVLVIVVVVLSLFFFYNPFNNTASRTSFSQVDFSALHWSGQNEGETVNRQTENSSSVRGMYIPPFSRYSLSTGLEEAAKLLGGKPLIPTRLPDGMIYSDVYIGPVVEICFSYNKSQNPLFSNVIIEISRPLTIPSLEEQKSNKSNLTGVRTVQAGDTWVSIQDKYYNDSEIGASWTPGYFYYGSLYYAMNVKYPLTNQDLTTIIGSMKTPT
jgi:hypothetical protein